ncbi:MAG: hypothetical protein ABL897_01395 [Hyphomicrobium sp.]
MSKARYELRIASHEEGTVILRINHNGKVWEVEVHCDAYGLAANIIRDSILCTGAEFGWNDNHENE